MSSPDLDFRSVTVWLNELKDGSDYAANELWQRYFARLVALARNRLANIPKRVSDEEDVALNVFHSLCQGAEQGRFDQLNDRDDLWRLLVVMTRHKSLNQIRQQRAQKRGGQNVRGNSIFEGAGSNASARDFDFFFNDEPTPEFLVEVQEEQQRLLNLLTDESHRRIAILRLQGYSVQEAAEKMGISARSIKRKLALIREIWALELHDDP